MVANRKCVQSQGEGAQGSQPRAGEVGLRANSAVVARYFSFGSSKSEKSENFRGRSFTFFDQFIQWLVGWFATRLYVRDVACGNVFLVLQGLCVFS